MAKRIPSLSDLSMTELKRLMVVKEKLEQLEAQKSSLLSEIAKIDAEMEKVAASWDKPKRGRPAKKKAKKKKLAKAVVKETARRATKKKAKRKAAAKKAGETTVKKAARKSAKKKVAKKAGKSGPTLEDVILKVLGKKKVSFQDLLATIQKDKLVTTKSKNFANVLRRTLSTSKKVKRVGRGVYSAA